MRSRPRVSGRGAPTIGVLWAAEAIMGVGAAGSHDSRTPVARRLDRPGQVLAR